MSLRKKWQWRTVFWTENQNCGFVLCDTVPGEMSACVLTPDREPVTDQYTGTTKAQLSQLLIDYLQEYWWEVIYSRRNDGDSPITKAHPGMGDSSQ